MMKHEVLSTGIKKLWPVLAAIMLLAGIVPVLHYWYYIGRVPGVTPLEARELLGRADANAVLIDVRSQENFAAMHISEASNWTYEEIIALSTADDIPEQYKTKTLLLICDSGIKSAQAAHELRSRFGLEVLDVRGGIQAWIASANEPNGKPVSFITASGTLTPAPSKISPWYEQLALAGAILIIKPLYMLIALVLIIILWKWKSVDALAMRWGLVFFLTGETACGVNIVFFNHSSYLLEFFHMYGMVLSFAFFAYAMIEILDFRILAYSDAQKKCALVGLCKQCAKSGGSSCGLKRMFYFVIPVFIILAFIPLLVNFNALSYNTKVLGMFFNYSHPVVYQFFEFRYAPVYAIIGLSVSFLAFLLTKGKNMTFLKLLFAIGIGPFAFSYLRMIFFNAYHDNMVWANAWEELTELIYTSGVAFTLWIFHVKLPWMKVEKGNATEENKR